MLVYSILNNLRETHVEFSSYPIHIQKNIVEQIYKRAVASKDTSESHIKELVQNVILSQPGTKVPFEFEHSISKLFASILLT